MDNCKGYTTSSTIPFPGRQCKYIKTFAFTFPMLEIFVKLNSTPLKDLKVFYPLQRPGEFPFDIDATVQMNMADLLISVFQAIHGLTPPYIGDLNSVRPKSSSILHQIVICY